MPNAIYQYVYYEPLAVGGPVTRQNRNPATSSKYLPVPGASVPSTNDLATGSIFTPDVPPPSITGGGYTYYFGFMNVSGCVGAGQTSTDIGHLPGMPPLAPLTVGTEVINILVVYIKHGGNGPGTGGPGIYIDAFDETTGTFLNNFFVTNITPDSGLTANANIYGSVAIEPHADTVNASVNPINTPGVLNSSAIFDKWVKLEGPGGNPVISGSNLVIGASTPSDITAFAFYKDPSSVYITGGYQSSDIILFTPFSTTSLGTPIPIGSAGTTIVAGVNYGFAAVVHNDSPYEVSTQVTFWNIPGGDGTMGALLDTQTVLIPSASSMTVISSQPFTNAGGHTCAVVSLYTADSPCQFQPTSSADSIHIPDPNANYARSCSAWRNTNTLIVFPGASWEFEVGLGVLHAEYVAAPIGIEITTLNVAADWTANDKVLAVKQVQKPAQRKAPAYLVPELRATLPAIDLAPTVAMVTTGKITAQKAGASYSLNLGKTDQTDFKVSGVVPATAKVGDTILVNVTANYPKTASLAARSVEFLEILVVSSK